MNYYNENLFVGCYNDIVNNLKTTFKKKNHDYGSSTVDVYEDFKDSYMVRISDKYNRARNLMKIGQDMAKVDEKLEDTILDMANYCILWLANINYEDKLESDIEVETTETVENYIDRLLDNIETIKGGDDIEH